MSLTLNVPYQKVHIATIFSHLQLFWDHDSLKYVLLAFKDVLAHRQPTSNFLLAFVGIELKGWQTQPGSCVMASFTANRSMLAMISTEEGLIIPR